MGRIENYLSHVVVDLSQSPETARVYALTQNMSDACLQAFPLMIREFWKLLSTSPTAKFDSLSPPPHREDTSTNLGDVVHKWIRSDNSLPAISLQTSQLLECSTGFDDCGQRPYESSGSQAGNCSVSQEKHHSKFLLNQRGSTVFSFLSCHWCRT